MNTRLRIDSPNLTSTVRFSPSTVPVVELISREHIAPIVLSEALAAEPCNDPLFSIWSILAVIPIWISAKAQRVLLPARVRSKIKNGERDAAFCELGCMRSVDTVNFDTILGLKICSLHRQLVQKNSKLSNFITSIKNHLRHRPSPHKPFKI